MSRVISKPGPPPTSCHTCRRRRKKCDLSRPYCERCLKGGHECLGYEDSKTHANVCREDPTVPIPPQLQSISPTDPAEIARSETLDSVTVGVPENCQDPTNTNPGYDPRRSILGAALLYRMSSHISSANGGCVTTEASEDFDRSWPQDQSRPIVYSRSRTRQASHDSHPFDITPSGKSTRNDLNKVIKTLCRSIPPSVDATQMMREGHFERVVNEYYLQRVSCWFTIPSTAILGAFVSQLKKSKRMTWTIYLGARLFRVLRQDSCGATIQGCIGWIDKLDQKFTAGSHNNRLLSDIADHFMVQLELAFFKFTMVDNSSGYALLQKAVPRFLQLIAADTNLYTEHPHGNLVVSFPHTLGSPRYELKRFIVYDTVAALVLGVPPLIEYGYDSECASSPVILEWIHGIPVALLEAISQINSWRANSRVPQVDWQALERRILAWQLPSAVPDEASTAVSTSMARAAVQESWQHVVLIYIYTGICGVSSHDPRVQASVHRIAQLGETVINLPIGVQMLAHCIVAGLAARLEKHRVLFYTMLQSFKETRVWLFRGPEFSQVLYHLWHGVGAGGAPVLWDDYIRSRCAVVPI